MFSLLFTLVLIALGTRSTATAQGEASSATLTPGAQIITYTVQAGDTLGILAKRYDTTVEELVALNDIENPDLILVGQVLTVSVPAGWAPPPTVQPSTEPSVPQPVGGPLAFTWSIVGWRPAESNYIVTLNIVPRGGVPPYTFYHDGLVQPDDTFEFAWLRCKPKPGSVGIGDTTGTYVKEDYWLVAPYCPTGVEILEPEEGEHLKHADYHFNITWKHTVSPPPDEYGIEIQVWEGKWRPWKQYVHKRADKELFFVPDKFPGDLGGRVRMWGIYGKRESKSKTPWRYFEFRVTY